MKVEGHGLGWGFLEKNPIKLIIIKALGDVYFPIAQSF